MEYVEIEIKCKEHLKEILTAELYALGYESFMDTDRGLKAYQTVADHSPEQLEKILSNYPQVEQFLTQEIAPQNWNEIWESNFSPISIGEICLVRASFHPPAPNYKYEIIIDPKMSFGTGHHETTSQMMLHQLQVDHTNKTVLDVGCGTGILSVFAEKLGAKQIQAFDNDPWAVSNARENIALNKCSKAVVTEDTIDSASLSGSFDIILANINRNVLLQEIPHYCTYLSKPGRLIISGFYTEDLPAIVNTCEVNGLLINAQSTENNWACLIFEMN